MQNKFRAAIRFLALVFCFAPLTSYADPTVIIRATGNFNANSTVVSSPGLTPTFAELDSGASYATTTTVFDSVGVSHVLYFYVFRDASAYWTVYMYVDGGDVVGYAAGTPIFIGKGKIEFDPDGDRPLPTPEPDIITAPIWANGSRTLNISISMPFVTQVVGTSSLAFTSITEPNNNRSCAFAASCTETLVQQDRRQCLSLANSCGAPAISLALTSEELADRVISKEKCTYYPLMQFPECNRCYGRAKARIFKERDSSTFRGFLNRARELVDTRRRYSCR